MAYTYVHPEYRAYLRKHLGAALAEAFAECAMRPAAVPALWFWSW